jgi:hypothetical protein
MDGYKPLSCSDITRLTLSTHPIPDRVSCIRVGFLMLTDTLGPAAPWHRVWSCPPCLRGSCATCSSKVSPKKLPSNLYAPHCWLRVCLHYPLTARYVHVPPPLHPPEDTSRMHTPLRVALKRGAVWRACAHQAGHPLSTLSSYTHTPSLSRRTLTAPTPFFAAAGEDAGCALFRGAGV